MNRRDFLRLRVVRDEQPPTFDLDCHALYMRCMDAWRAERVAEPLPDGPRSTSAPSNDGVPAELSELSPASTSLSAEQPDAAGVGVEAVAVDPSRCSRDDEGPTIEVAMPTTSGACAERTGDADDLLSRAYDSIGSPDDYDPTAGEPASQFEVPSVDALFEQLAVDLSRVQRLRVLDGEWLQTTRLHERISPLLDAFRERGGQIVFDSTLAY